MGAGDERSADMASLPFFGTVVAAQCHEVVNVLNTVNEVAGLIDDLAAAGADDRARVQVLAQKIQAQVQRGQGLVRNISRFAHTTDTSHAVVDVVELLRSAVDLVERPVRLARSSLTLELPERPAVIETCPFLVVRLVFSAVDACLSPAPASIALRVRVEDRGLLFQAERVADAPGLLRRDLVAGVAAQAQALGGELREPGSASRIVFFLPARATR